MPTDDTRELTRLLQEINGGREDAFVELVDAVYADIRHIAAGMLRRQCRRPLDALTYTPTEIAHDAFMELRSQYCQWHDRGHFYAVATHLIHRQVMAYHRRRLAQKAGAGHRGISLDLLPEDPPDLSVPIPLDCPALEALRRLHEQHPRAAEVVSLHVICNHCLPEVGLLLGISLRSVERDWALGRRWLQRELADG